ncbi:MAG: alanine-tRNA synthetase second additional domain-containing protein [Oscillospiraceae bacterium]|nr:alanine-tRNA synthetase second additional domain-containing protein [Oscillospiraceae bacterium]
MSLIPLQRNHLYSIYFAPRGNRRMAQLGMQLAQLHLSPFDQLIGVMGEAGSGKSLLIKGMFPGLELTNDDEGVNIRPLPILDVDSSGGFFSNHTYHMDIRFESAFTQMHDLAEAVKKALTMGKRVVVEHFDLLYPFLDKRNADVLIGVGAEVAIARTTIFGPLPDEIAKMAFDTIKYRKMAHTAEDLIDYLLTDSLDEDYEHSDVRNGFVLRFQKRPIFDLERLAKNMEDLIDQDIPISYADENHINVGDRLQRCTGPRMHVRSTGEIEVFRLLDHIIYDAQEKRYLLVGLVGKRGGDIEEDLNRLGFGG